MPTPAADREPTAAEADQPLRRMPSAGGATVRDAEDLANRDVSIAPSASDRRFLLSVSILMLLLTSIHLARMAWQGRETIDIERLESRQFEFHLDVNEATWVEWMQIPSIGELTARRIVAHRAEHGPFASVDDVQRVPGIGPATLEAIRPYLRYRELNEAKTDGSTR